MKTLKIIAIVILITMGFIAIVAELVVPDEGIRHILANMVIRVCGVLMIIYAYHIIVHINDIEPLEVEYEDDDMNRKIGEDEELE